MTIWTLSAQEVDENKSHKVKFGIKLGVNLANVTETPAPTNASTSNLLGFNGGVFSTIKLVRNFAIQPELLYSQMGSKVSYNDYIGDNKKLLMTYVNVSMLAKFHPCKPFALLAGPQIGFLNSATSQLAITNGPSNDFSRLVKKNDFSAILGTEFKLSDILFLSARYQIGMANVSNSTDGGTDKNNCFTFTIDLLLSY